MHVDDGAGVAAEGVCQFVTDVIQRAGGTRSVVEALTLLGFRGRDGAYADTTVRSWRVGAKCPNADILLALARHFGVSLDGYVLADSMRAELDGLKERVAALESGAA